MGTLFWKFVREHGHNLGLATRPLQKTRATFLDGERIEPFLTLEGRLFFGVDTVMVEALEMVRWRTNLGCTLNHLTDQRESTGWGILEVLRYPEPFTHLQRLLPGILAHLTYPRRGKPKFLLDQRLDPAILQRALSLAGVLTTSVRPP